MLHSEKKFAFEVFFFFFFSISQNSKTDSNNYEFDDDESKNKFILEQLYALIEYAYDHEEQEEDYSI